jgi:hypothetical protein
MIRLGFLCTNTENGGTIAAIYCLCAPLHRDEFDCIRSDIEALFKGTGGGVKNLIEAITSQTGGCPHKC